MEGLDHVYDVLADQPADREFFALFCAENDAVVGIDAVFRGVLVGEFFAGGVAPAHFVLSSDRDGFAVVLVCVAVADIGLRGGVSVAS